MKRKAEISSFSTKYTQHRFKLNEMLKITGCLNCSFNSWFKIIKLSKYRHNYDELLGNNNEKRSKNHIFIPKKTNLELFQYIVSL